MLLILGLLLLVYGIVTANMWVISGGIGLLLIRAWSQKDGGFFDRMWWVWLVLGVMCLIWIFGE